MPEVTEEPTTARVSWVPDLTTIDLTTLGAMDDTDLAQARERLLGKFDRPFATVAGSEGS